MSDVEVAGCSRRRKIFRSLTLAALGVVFGDIGTSPLYAVREAFHGLHAIPVTPVNIMGTLSMILWSLIMVISIKYLVVIMKANNRGEGGVLALSSLAFPPRVIELSSAFRFLFFVGLFGAALLVGDGMITPAISVLSAVEGLSVVTPYFSPYVIPIALLIITFLFMNQRHGSAKLGAIFGVFVIIWFITLGSLGIYGILLNPKVLLAINPVHAVSYFLENGGKGFIVLGAVFLAVTGGEAIYADMGHFGINPIRKAWFFVAFPGLILNYFGQGALLLASPEHAVNPFYHLAPSWFALPLVIIATCATIIASQAVISGVFSLTRQAIQLGYAPRFMIVHTSREEIGQIYIPKVNWILYLSVCLLVIGFKTSSNIAAAYGVAVSTTMAITSILACAVARRVWGWSWLKLLSVFSIFLAADLAFLTANFSKIPDGGWFPLLIGIIVFTLMTTWRRGRQILWERLRENSVPIATFIKKLEAQPPARVSGISVFMTSDPDGTPPALIHNVQHNKVLHHKNLLLTILTREIPCISAEERVTVEKVSDDFYRITAFYGFTETPDIHDILQACTDKGVHFPMDEITFFLGRETLIPTKRPGMALWREHLFTLMSRNAERATAYFNIPSDRVVEIGIQVKL
jgi:KUP system potassium uptake protein